MDDSVGFFNLVGKTEVCLVSTPATVGGCHGECMRRAVTPTVLRRNSVNNAHVRQLRI